jgi:hypothetical protein
LDIFSKKIKNLRELENSDERSDSSSDRFGGRLEGVGKWWYKKVEGIFGEFVVKTK